MNYLSNSPKKGSIISAPFWPELVIVDSIEIIDNNLVRITGSSFFSKKHIDDIIPISEFEKIQFQKIENYFNNEAWKVFLALETIRYRFASLYDPLLAMNISKIDPLPHQIEAVYGYVLKLPRIRFLIADDPGAGKTIMAGLIIKELKLRQLVKRILIVCPGHLKDQWRRELKERFEEEFELIDRERLDASYRVNIWERENQIITSMDFAKREDVLPTIRAAHFDLIIVDEAHKFSAYRYGEKTSKSERYKLGEILSSNTTHLLFLTATPHKGDPENFRLFIDLLEPGFFATTELIDQSIKNKDNPLLIRRIKEDLKDFDGKPLFLPRKVITFSFNLGVDSQKEKELYNALSKYVTEQFTLATDNDRKRNITFALVILQRRFASSTYALLKSLERRKQRLQNLFNSFQQNLNYETIDLEEIDELSEEERWEIENKWEALSVAKNIEELKKEIQIIEDLISRAREIIDNEDEIKFRKLKEALQNIFSSEKESSSKKVLIFTESKDTLEYLTAKLRNLGYKVNNIHGGMRLQERVEAETIFKNETDIMVATEAAGEGINLQFCHIMINYDIPWNPNRLEQRMGRIHRYGQTKEVFIYNFVAIDTREGQVLNALLKKLEEIKSVLGSDKVFDVVSEVIDSKKFIQAMVDAVTKARDIDEILKDFEIKVDQEYINGLKEKLGESLATRFIDFTRIREMAQQAKENRLIPEYTQNFFLKVLDKLGGKYELIEQNLISITQIPAELKKIANDEIFKKNYGTIISKYPKATFDKELSLRNPKYEFISFGHPLFEAALQWVEKNLNSSVLSGAVFYDPDCKLNGYVIFYEGEISDGTGNIAGKRLFAYYITDNIVKEISPSIIWDLVEENNLKNFSNLTDIEELKKKVLPYAINSLINYKKELLIQREKHCEIKKKYGIKSLEYLIYNLDNDLISLYERKSYGENVDLAIRIKEEKKNDYEEALKKLKDLIVKETNLSMSTPKFLGIIKVEPLLTENVNEMISDEKIEKIGMEKAIEYEIKSGRNPEDVSQLNLGFDIRSIDSSGNTLYIEVKARAGKGKIALTQNEWFKAQRFGDDYYLYVVFNAISNPELIIIKNPAKNLSPQIEFENVRFAINQEEITSKGMRV